MPETAWQPHRSVNGQSLFDNYTPGCNPPAEATAFGKWPGFVLMLITILTFFTVSLVAAVAIGRKVLNLLG